ncbi:MAG: Lrp/AsnC family transcriptional regulator [Candidatus Aenigmarchaeota archaeon]|nr:Lrp/AsnC family transcriptional regulator [Candidatus Aenigmarchaeota archaeon]
MAKLDQKDRRILYELDKNARQPLSRIAKKVQLSRESVLYRLRKYLKEGVIRNYLTVVDMAKLGFTHHKVFVKLHNITEEQEKRFIQFLIENPHVSWISSCDGKYSLIFALKARSMVELNTVMKEIKNKFWQFIMEQDTTTIINANHFYRDYLIKEQGTTERKIEWGGKPEEVKLDETNVAILDALSRNTRMNAVEIANELNISADAVIQRIKKLEQSRIITHYMLWPDVNKLKGMFYKVLISLHNLNAEREKKLLSYCLQNPNIVYVVNALGPWQFEMDIEIENIQEFRNLIRDFLNHFSDIISDYSVLNIYEEYKFRFFEKVLF